MTSSTLLKNIHLFIWYLSFLHSHYTEPNIGEKNNTHWKMCSLYCEWDRFVFSCTTHNIKHWKKTYVHPLVKLFKMLVGCFFSWTTHSMHLRVRIFIFIFLRVKISHVSIWELFVSIFLGVRISERFMLPLENVSFPEGESFWVFHASIWEVFTFIFLRVRVSECFMFPIESNSLCWEFLTVSDFFPVWNERVEFWNGRLHDNSQNTQAVLCTLTLAFWFSRKFCTYFFPKKYFKVVFLIICLRSRYFSNIENPNRLSSKRR